MRKFLNHQGLLDNVGNKGYNIIGNECKSRRILSMYTIHVRPERELRNNFSEISKLSKGHNAVVLTNRGKGTHVLISFEEFNEYEEFRHNRYLMQKIKEAENDPDTSLLGHEEVWAKLGEEYGL
jgi:prevent-host-death family protein